MNIYFRGQRRLFFKIVSWQFTGVTGNIATTSLTVLRGQGVNSSFVTFCVKTFSESMISLPNWWAQLFLKIYPHWTPFSLPGDKIGTSQDPRHILPIFRPLHSEPPAIRAALSMEASDLQASFGQQPVELQISKCTRYFSPSAHSWKLAKGYFGCFFVKPCF